MGSVSYQIPDYALEPLAERIRHLNRRAARLGVPDIVLRQTGETFVPADRAHPERGSVRRLVIEVDGAAPRLEGWRLAARLAHSKEGTQLSTISMTPADIPAELRERPPSCEHCKTTRSRRTTFLLTNEDGEWAQVAGSCLSDFVGRGDPHRLAEIAELASDAVEAIDRAETGALGKDPMYYYATLDVLATTAAVIRKDGWVSRTAARANLTERLDATADTVLEILASDGRHRDEMMGYYPVREEDRTTAAGALAWVRSLPDEKCTSSDYLWNLRLAADADETSPSRFGLVCSIVAAHQRELERERARAEEITPTDECFGTPGKRESFTLRCVGARAIDSDYGASTMFRFLDPENRAAVWFTTGDAADFEPGGTYQVKATVKRHDEYRGTKQTRLSRVTIDRGLARRKRSERSTPELPAPTGTLDRDAVARRIEESVRRAGFGSLDEARASLRAVLADTDDPAPWTFGAFVAWDTVAREAPLRSTDGRRVAFVASADDGAWVATRFSQTGPLVPTPHATREDAEAALRMEGIIGRDDALLALSDGGVRAPGGGFDARDLTNALAGIGWHEIPGTSTVHGPVAMRDEARCVLERFAVAVEDVSVEPLASGGLAVRPPLAVLANRCRELPEDVRDLLAPDLAGSLPALAPATPEADRLPAPVRAGLEQRLARIGEFAAREAAARALDERAGESTREAALRERLGPGIDADALWLERFRDKAVALGIDPDRVLSELGGVPDLVPESPGSMAARRAGAAEPTAAVGSVEGLVDRVASFNSEVARAKEFEARFDLPGRYEASVRLEREASLRGDIDSHGRSPATDDVAARLVVESDASAAWRKHLAERGPVVAAPGLVAVPASGGFAPDWSMAFATPKVRTAGRYEEFRVAERLETPGGLVVVLTNPSATTAAEDRYAVVAFEDRGDVWALRTLLAVDGMGNRFVPYGTSDRVEVPAIADRGDCGATPELERVTTRLRAERVPGHSLSARLADPSVDVVRGYDERTSPPPASAEGYLSMALTRETVNAPYFDTDGQVVASSRTTRAAVHPFVPGDWRIDGFAGPRGHAIEQLRVVPVSSLVATEEVGPERREDVERYAEWARNGYVPPPISVVEASTGELTGELRVTDGHRRLAAAIEAGHDRVIAWVAPRAATGEVTPDGEPLYASSGLTLEMATGSGRAVGVERSIEVSRSAEAFYGM